MWHCHMMTFHGVVNRQKILDQLNTMPEVVNWRAAAGGIFIVTGVHITSSALALSLHGRLPDVFFVMAPIAGIHAQGNVDQKTWDFINYPKPS